MSENKKQNKADKVFSFVKRGLKYSIFTRDEDRSRTNEIIKGGIVGTILTLKDFLVFIGSGVVVCFYYIINIFFTFKTLPSQFKKSAKNNFRLGLEALKVNNIIDARIRFLLSNMFFSKSPTTKYYIAYSYYLQHKYTKSLKYLKSALQIEPEHERCIGLVKQIEAELMNSKQKH